MRQFWSAPCAYSTTVSQKSIVTSKPSAKENIAQHNDVAKIDDTADDISVHL